MARSTPRANKLNCDPPDNPPAVSGIFLPPLRKNHIAGAMIVVHPKILDSWKDSKKSIILRDPNTDDICITPMHKSVTKIRYSCPSVMGIRDCYDRGFNISKFRRMAGLLHLR